ncbi:DUF2809 domain-containing protein [Bradyrhizobium sp.]|uniref:ribosomal maturation YjgA family protein n=1 Tax=Bradyrhizobium sp. TaxID=376 RepID=UPI003BB204F7
MHHVMPSRGAKSIVRAGLCLPVVICGLALRLLGPGLGLPAFVVKYGGSLLWAAMVFFLVAIAASRSTRRSVVMVAAVIAVGVELFRLVHTPWLDSFRLTMAGALLLGRIFSPWDILAYAIGIALGALLDNLVLAMVRSARPHSAS